MPVSNTMLLELCDYYDSIKGPWRKRIFGDQTNIKALRRFIKKTYPIEHIFTKEERRVLAIKVTAGIDHTDPDSASKLVFNLADSLLTNHIIAEKLSEAFDLLKKNQIEKPSLKNNIRLLHARLLLDPPNAQSLAKGYAYLLRWKPALCMGYHEFLLKYAQHAYFLAKILQELDRAGLLTHENLVTLKNNLKYTEALSGHIIWMNSYRSIIDQGIFELLIQKFQLGMDADKILRECVTYIDKRSDISDGVEDRASSDDDKPLAAASPEVQKPTSRLPSPPVPERLASSTHADPLASASESTAPTSPAAVPSIAPLVAPAVKARPKTLGLWKTKGKEYVEKIHSIIPGEARPKTFRECMNAMVSSEDVARLTFSGGFNWFHIIASLSEHYSELPSELFAEAIQAIQKFHSPYERTEEGKTAFSYIGDDPDKLVDVFRPNKFFGVDKHVTRLRHSLQTIKDNPSVETHLILLAGPPGVGKTALIEHVATNQGFRIVEFAHGDDEDRFVGALESRIQKYFDEAMAASKDQPVCLHVDEIDSLLPDREVDPISASAHDPSKEINLFQNKITALKGHRVVLIGSTNYLSRIKPAVLSRAGGPGAAILFTLPNEATRKQLIEDLLRNTILEAKSTIIERLARASAGWAPRELIAYIEGVLMANSPKKVISNSDFEEKFEEIREGLERAKPGEVAMIAPKLIIGGAKGVLPLSDALKATADQISDFVEDPKRYTESFGPEYTIHTLLHGAPGNGKTQFARYIVDKSHSPCFLVDPAHAKGMDQVFARARACERAIVFIDEFDRFGSLASPFRDQLQVEMQGFLRAEGTVVVIAATNYIGEIAKAIKSRFRKVVEVPSPNKAERTQLFLRFLNEIRGKASGLLDSSLVSEVEAGCLVLADSSEGLSIRDIKTIIESVLAVDIYKKAASPQLARLLKAIDERSGISSEVVPTASPILGEVSSLFAKSRPAAADSGSSVRPIEVEMSTFRRKSI